MRDQPLEVEHEHPERCVPLVEPVLGPHSHVCVFYNSHEEEYRVLLPFITEGFEKGDKTFHIIDERNRSEHLRRLQEAGIEVTGAEGEGRVEVRGWANAHLRPAWFDQHAMLALAEEVLSKTKRQGFLYTRWVANVGWALEEVRGTEGLGGILCSAERRRCELRRDHGLYLRLCQVQRAHDRRRAPLPSGGHHRRMNAYFVPPEALLQELQRGKHHVGAA
ncbi:MAG: MEDS domain-containing protein [Gammaproteobacteria bacterium]